MMCRLCSARAVRSTAFPLSLRTTSSKFKSKVSVNITKNSVVKKTISKLKSKKKYYVRIRTYTKNGNSKYYSAWSKVKAVVTK